MKKEINKRSKLILEIKSVTNRFLLIEILIIN